uniref:Uncharacterized protein n=1 Tax=Moorella thermoacetica (strain ATCC 39073 / JCM 9320) TaxID=264732 RepID=Q2RLF9_MOOTA
MKEVISVKVVFLVAMLLATWFLIITGVLYGQISFYKHHKQGLLPRGEGERGVHPGSEEVHRPGGCRPDIKGNTSDERWNRG